MDISFIELLLISVIAVGICIIGLLCTNFGESFPNDDTPNFT